MAGIPVVIASNGLGLPVRQVTGGAPVMTVATNGWGIPIALSSRGVPFIVQGTEDPAATAYFAAMSVQPSDPRKVLLNALIVGLKADGVWSLLDWISIMAAHDAQAGRINAKTPAQVATANGTLTFTTDRGYAGNAVDGYLETSVADNAAGNWTQNAASMFAWVNQAPVVGSATVGLSAVASTRLFTNAAVAPTARLHNATNVAGTTANSLGLSAVVRTDSVTTQMYRAGLLEATATTTAAVATTANTFQFLRAAGAFGDAHIAIGGWGGLLDATQSLALYTRLNTYLTAVGGA